jgi:ABC-type phosphate transport system substrate-binding protein
VALALLGSVHNGVAPIANAATPDVLLFADPDLGDVLTQGVQDLGVESGQVQVRQFPIDAACATDPGPVARLALMARTPTPAQTERCTQNADATVNAIAVGHQAIAVVTPRGAPVWSLDPAALFRALGQNAGEMPHPISWREINRNYPNLPIGLLMPKAGTVTQHLFDALIMDPGCDSAAGVHISLSHGRFCTELRTDLPISRRLGGMEDVASWAVTAAPGHIAIVTIAELAQLGSRVVPLPLNDVLPTGANIDSGRYPEATQVELLIVVPRATDQQRRNEARVVAFKLLAEASIGPTGTLASAGLIPLPPSERVAARSETIPFLEQQ